MKEFAICIFGPTGVGKSALAIKLAKSHGEIISVDSRQIYKYMDIGTAKPDQNELKEVKHHLIDIITPDIQFTAGKFKREAQKLIKVIAKDGKIPFLVGGTGLYFSALIRGMINIPIIDEKVKEYLNNKLEIIGQERLFGILERLDNEYSKKIHPNDKQRTFRALEVIIGTKKKFSDFLKENNQKEECKYIIIGINTDREKLYNVINTRVDKMMDAGLIKEVEKLLATGYKKDDPGMKTIGYKEIVDYLVGETSLDEAVYLIKRNSRRYAKRQLVWFRNVKDVNWFENTDFDVINTFINNKIKKFVK